MNNSILRICALTLSALGFTLAGCNGGGGGSSGSASSNAFKVESISVLNGSTWQINRPIEIRFSEPVDFGTVNLNTIQVAKIGGAPAAGEFRIGTTSSKILFVPRCPTLPDYSDAGLQPGGVAYRINIVGGGGLTVMSQSAKILSLGQTVDFFTPNSTQASVLFVDTQPGPPSPVILPEANSSYIELAGSSAPADHKFFEPRATFVPELGADVPAGFLAPLNLYSQVSEQLALVLVVNQSVDPATTNINASNVRLEYQATPGCTFDPSSTWIPLAHDVTLVANCTETGAVIRVTPTGILPQQRIVRTVFASGLRDVVGDVNLVDITVGSFCVKTASGTPGDEILEPFTTNAHEDQVTQFTSPTAPRAQWGVVDAQGEHYLAPNFDFAGTGGPGGTFDYEIGSSAPGSQPENPILDTTYTLITNSGQTATEAVVNGVVDVRDFIINQGSSLTVIGPNSLKILATRDVKIYGSLLVRGSNKQGVATLNTTCLPEVGAEGNAGGGKGGTASYLTTQSTPKGQDGYGAFGIPGLGGEGGHSAYAPVADESRRPGGGGGGRLGLDVLEVLRPTCPDQTFVGLDAENGFNGTQGANDAILGAGVKPKGGNRGPRPFGNSDPNDDFYGYQVTTNGVVIRGELSQVWAGPGGGGGGNTCQTSQFPTTPFSCSGDEKGCGGGGGGGSVTILALNDIIIGSLPGGLGKGKIDATGGAGGGGENSIGGGITRIGGGSGGGAGGHVVLQAAHFVDLSTCIVGNGAPGSGFNEDGGGIFARGGQGGEGKNQIGGAHPPGNGPYSASTDALPPNSYPSATAECRVVSGSFGYLFNNTVGNPAAQNENLGVNVSTDAGGDGGPGMIQIHVGRLSNTPASSDLKIPANTTTNPLRRVISPTPIGATPTNIQTLGSWNQMLPQFGRVSTAVSEWIPIGAANVTLASQTPHAVQFNFQGTNPATGLINTTGANGNVTELPPISIGTLAAPSTAPFASYATQELVIDASALDPVYKNNPSLLKKFGVRILHGATLSEYEVSAGAYTPPAPGPEVMKLKLEPIGSTGPLSSATATAGDAYTVIPRFFRVKNGSINDNIGPTATIQIRFQAAPADAAGNPTLTGSTGFLNDATQIQAAPGAANFKFVRFRVDFDLLAIQPPPPAPLNQLSSSTPRPKIDFLRLPFKF